VPRESALGVSLLNRRAAAAWRRRHHADDRPDAPLRAARERIAGEAVQVPARR